MTYEERAEAALRSAHDPIDNHFDSPLAATLWLSLYLGQAIVFALLAIAAAIQSQES